MPLYLEVLDEPYEFQAELLSEATKAQIEGTVRGILGGISVMFLGKNIFGEPGPTPAKSPGESAEKVFGKEGLKFIAKQERRMEMARNK